MRRKILAVLTAAVLLVSMLAVSASAAETGLTDIAGHWGEEAIERWYEADVIHGSNGKYQPNKNMSRGELATVMDDLLGLSETGASPFADLTGKWYDSRVIRAYYGGIMQGEIKDGKRYSQAERTITRQESMVMMGRALGVEPASSTASLEKFQDDGSVQPWAAPMMAAMVEKGFVNGTSANVLSPKGEITKAQVAQVLNASVSTYITEPGSHNVAGDGIVVVKADGDVTITGEAGGVVVAQGSSDSNVTLSGAEIGGNVKVDGSGVTLSVENSKVEGVALSETASGAKVDVAAGSTVEKVSTQADNAAVSGSGEVKKVEVTGGDKVDISTSGTKVEVDKDAVSSTVTAGGTQVKPGETGSTTGSGSGYEEGGSTVTPDPGPVDPTPPTPVDPDDPTPETFTVTFDLNGAGATGAPADLTNIQSGATITKPAADPTREGYLFAGWYKEANGTTAWDWAADKVTGNVTLYAKWNQKVYGTMAAVEDMAAPTITTDNTTHTVTAAYANAKIDYLPSDGVRDAGNWVAVKIIAPQGFDTTNTTFSNDFIHSDWGHPEGDEENSMIWTHQVTDADQASGSFTATVTWQEGNAQTFQITLSNCTLLPKPATVLGTLYPANIFDQANQYTGIGTGANELAAAHGISGTGIAAGQTCAAALTEENVIEVNVATTGLKQHQNAQGSTGYFSGIALVKPAGADDVYCAVGKTKPEPASLVKNGLEGSVDGQGHDGIAIFLDVKTSGAINQENKDCWFAVQWYQNNQPMDEPVYYHISFANCTTAP